MPAIVQLTDVTKCYRTGARVVHALRGVTLRLETPGFYGIMGPSGCGKSTLLHLLAALDRPDDGAIAIAGERLDTMPEHALTRFRRTRIGIVFQQFNLIPTLTAAENVALPALLDGMPRRDRTARSLALLDRLGIVDRAEHRPDALSGGEQQRVAIARALVFAPPVLLADEPTGSLDSATSESLWSVLRELSDEQTMTILMVTHEPAAAVHCERVFLLRDGRIGDTFEVEGLDAGQLATRAQHAGR